MRNLPPSQPTRAPRAGLAGPIIIAAALIFAAIYFVTGMQEAAQRANPVNMIATVLPQATPTIIARPPAIVQIRALAELSTVATTMSTVVEASKPRVQGVVAERLLLIACGRVKAGVDLSKLRTEDVVVSPNGKTVSVRLPKAELQDVYLIDDSTQPCTTRVYDRTNLIVLAETKELEGQAREEGIKAIRAMALQSGILKDADRNARVAIDRVLGAAGFETVEFVDTP